MAPYTNTKKKWGGRAAGREGGWVRRKIHPGKSLGGKEGAWSRKRGLLPKSPGFPGSWRRPGFFWG